MARLSGDELAAFVAASCERSGVSVKVTDPWAVRTVTALLTGTPITNGQESSVAERAS